MPYMKEHLEAGFYASMGVVALLMAGFHYGHVATQYDVFRFSLFAVIGIVIGSDLPNIDAKSAPISKMFQILVPGAVVLLSLGLSGVWPPLAFALGPGGLKWGIPAYAILAIDTTSAWCTICLEPMGVEAFDHQETDVGLVLAGLLALATVGSASADRQSIHGHDHTHDCFHSNNAGPHCNGS